MKIPKTINICGDIVKIMETKKLKTIEGYYDCQSKMIILDANSPDIGGTLLHEIMEYIAARTFSISFKKGVRNIRFLHEPDKTTDTWCIYVEILIDTIRRNKLGGIFNGKENKGK